MQKAYGKLPTIWLKEKKWELTEQLECDGLPISLLYGAHKHQGTNEPSAAIRTGLCSV